MKLKTFEVEKWMDEHETTAKYNLAETCCASMSIDHLLSLSNTPGIDALSLLTPSHPQTYGEIRGLSSLRSNLASLYSARAPAPVSPDSVLITPGAIAANFLCFYALLEPGDGVVCMYPTYQQLYSVPRSLGCDVKLWKVRRADGGRRWEWDVEKLKKLCGEGTKMVVLNNPNNPTGAILTKPQMQAIAAFCAEKSITLLVDEVYRPIFHGISPTSDDFPPSALNIPGAPSRTIITGSMSKAYSLAGIRAGWIACRDKDVIERLAAARHYTTISVSQMDQQVAALATSHMCLHALLQRNINLAKGNAGLVEKFVDEHYKKVEWAKPVAGTTALLRFSREGKPVEDVIFCERLQQETGVMLLPAGRGFGDEAGETWTGWVRMGYVNSEEVVKEGLERLREFMRRGFREVPLAGG